MFCHKIKVHYTFINAPYENGDRIVIKLINTQLPRGCISARGTTAIRVIRITIRTVSCLTIT
ncbi:unknown protein [Microcystis aeruginosa NIES-843]|uniref:Uncharacterized protein n=1 Tax=Microcystis aeruginosa (strain NIES-843 / IAM M-2473) TaxID=449447 RepID=B0JR52_MICAN|nr:unknown protein [Microcystis aeruginosa NIES-843]